MATIFDLNINNAAMNVISPSVIDSLTFLQDVLCHKLRHLNYFQTNNILRHLRPSDKLNELLSHVAKQKLKTLNTTIYVQMWQKYSSFMYELIDLMGDKGVSAMFSSVFYEQVIAQGDVTTFIQFDDVQEEDFCELLASLHFIYKYHPNVGDQINQIITMPQMLECTCRYMHCQLLKICNDAIILDNPEYYLMQPYAIKKNIIAIANVIMDVLCTHVTQRTKFISIYTNYLQLRIAMPKYDNLDLEMMFAEKIFGNSNNSMCSAILDIKRRLSLRIDNVKVEPLVLKKDNWNVDDVQFVVKYPAKMKYYLDKISAHYESDNIRWQPTLGVCKIRAFLGKDVTITCNFLQAIAMIYFDGQTETFTVQEFSDFTHINIELSSKIFESLVESYIITCDVSMTEYVINTKYNGSIKIDIRPIFVKVFEVSKN